MSPSTTAGAIPAVTDHTFADDVLANDRPVLVDFWAQWCGPCHMLAAVLREIADERADVLSIRALNADENPLSARDYHVLSLPTMILFRGGKPVWSAIGARPKSRLLSELDGALR